MATDVPANYPPPHTTAYDLMDGTVELELSNVGGELKATLTATMGQPDMGVFVEYVVASRLAVRS
jgi:hypothetical protein